MFRRLLQKQRDRRAGLAEKVALLKTLDQALRNDSALSSSSWEALFARPEWHATTADTPKSPAPKNKNKTNVYFIWTLYTVLTGIFSLLVKIYLYGYLNSLHNVNGDFIQFIESYLWILATLLLLTYVGEKWNGTST